MRAGLAAGLGLLALAASGCGTHPAQEAFDRANEPDKRFRGVWLQRTQNAITGPEVVRVIRASVDGEKFRIAADAAPDGPRFERADEEVVCDGTVLWRLDHPGRMVHRIELEDRPWRACWSAPENIRRLGEPSAGEDEAVAGRLCAVHRFAGKRDGADVTATYWIDRGSGIVLRKRFMIEAGPEVLALEEYACEEIEMDPAFGDGEFAPGVPASWVTVEQKVIESPLLLVSF